MGLSTFEVFKRNRVAGFVELSGSQSKKLKEELLKIFKDVDAACRAEEIPYFLCGGSCLGAVRHEGFIPWDDDFDIVMTREGYERLTRSFNSVLGDLYYLQGPGVTPGYELGFARVRKRGTTLRIQDDFDSRDCGIFIDIFILDGVPDFAPLRLFHGFVSLALGFALSCRRYLFHREAYLVFSGDNGEMRRIVTAKARLGALFGLLTPARWCSLWDKWNSLYRKASPKLVSIPAGRKHYFGEMLEFEDCFPTREGRFEGMVVPLPANPDKYLRQLYGDSYMTPPPPNERENHSIVEIDFGSSGVETEDRVNESQ